MGCNGAECNCRFGITPEDSRLGQPSSLSLSQRSDIITTRFDHLCERRCHSIIEIRRRFRSICFRRLLKYYVFLRPIEVHSKSPNDVVLATICFISRTVYIYRERQRIASRLASRIRRVVGNTRCLGIRLHHAKIYIYIYVRV